MTILLSVLPAGVVIAQAGPLPNADELYSKALKGAEDLQALRGDLFGDRTGMQTGSTEFLHVDVTVPSNGEIPVTLGRRYRVRYEAPQSLDNLPDFTNQVLGVNWQLDVPYITGTFEQRQYLSDQGQLIEGDGWTTAAALALKDPDRGRRCSVSSFAPATQVPSLSPYYRTIGVGAHNYWSGNQINVPGAGEERMLSIRDVDTRPSDGRVYWGTTRSGWRISCLPLRLAPPLEGGEGFRVTLPSGVIYDFDWMVKRKATDLTDGAGHDDWHTLVRRDEYFIFATRATDRHGNWVAWNYDPSNPFRLQSITSSDGITINVQHGANGKISTVSTGGRTWTYQYSSQLPNSSLVAVVQPDASRWTFQYTGFGLSLDVLRYRELCNYQARSLTTALPADPGDIGTITMTHPSGATGLFGFRNLLHGTNNTPGSCSVVSIGGVTGSTTTAEIGVPKAYVDVSLVSKRITGPGLPGYSWTYAYAPNWSYYNECPNGSCATTSTTTETRPDGSRVLHRYGNRYDTNSGRLLSKDYRDAANQVLRTETYTYLASAPLYPPTSRPDLPISRYGCSNDLAPAQTFPEAYGCDSEARLENPLSRAVRPVVDFRIQQSGATFVTSNSEFDSRARPIRVTRQTLGGASKTDVSTYHDNSVRWVLGQVASVRNSDTGVVELSQQFDPDRALPTSESQFGRPPRTMVYWANGKLWHETIGNGFRMSYSAYKRSIPQTIVQGPTMGSYTVAVDDNGWISYRIDPMSNGTVFAYDSGGRLSNVTHPTEDTTAWAATNQQFAQVDVEEYGIEPGHWRRISDTGARRTVTYYDALWRPVLTREFDSRNPSVPERFVARRFDYEGRQTFQSYATDSASSWASLVTGTTTSFDAIGRVASVSQDSELGTLVSTTTWLSGFQKRVTNPRGISTTYTFRTLGEPTEDQPTTISAPESVTTTISRDVWGKPVTMSRASWYYNGASMEYTLATRSFVYDGFQQLCKRIDPEHGATVFEYDAGGNISWSADGLALPSTSTCNRESVPQSSRVVRSYDELNRLSAIDYPDSSDDAGFTYFLDGKLRTATIGATSSPVTWTYTYNKRRMLEGEHLTQDGRVFELLYRFNDRGDASQIRYPDGEWVSMFPDALGRPTQLSGSSGSYAHSIRHHPNGVLANLTYANGVNYAQTVSVRGLPSRRSYVLNGSQTLVDHSIVYDQNANPVEILDLFGSLASYANESRFLGYDGLDRLVTANSAQQPALRSTPWQFSWGAGAFEYDALDNVRRGVIGPADFRYSLDAQQRVGAMLLGGSLFRGYTYNARGQMTQRAHDDGTHSLAWDSAHRLLSVSSTSGYWETHRYDAHGHRVRTQRSGETVWSVYSRAGQLMFEQTASGASRRFVHLGDRLVAETENGQRSYVHTDLVGTVRMKTNAFGNVTLEDVRAPYGSVLLGRSYRNGFAYAGHVESAGTALSYMEARYYDPISMRFLSPDPVHADQGTGANFNRYWYANNSPYKYSDPDGKLANFAIGFAIGFGVDAISQLISGKEVNLKQSLVSGLAGSLTGGVGSILTSTVRTGTLTAAQATLGTAVVGAASGGAAVFGAETVGGAEVTDATLAASVLVGGLGGGASVASANAAVAGTGMLAAAARTAPLGSPAGIAATVKATTDALPEAGTTGYIAGVAAGVRDEAAAKLADSQLADAFKEDDP